jgi:pimeloyl-ACP methyl ester carboxylesterase
MGAGVALNVAARYPERVAGSVLARPAWLDRSMPDGTVALFALVARILRELGYSADTDEGLDWACRRLQRLNTPDLISILVCWWDQLHHRRERGRDLAPRHHSPPATLAPISAQIFLDPKLRARSVVVADVIPARLDKAPDAALKTV